MSCRMSAWETHLCLNKIWLVAGKMKALIFSSSLLFAPAHQWDHVVLFQISSDISLLSCSLRSYISLHFLVSLQQKQAHPHHSWDEPLSKRTCSPCPRLELAVLAWGIPWDIWQLEELLLLSDIRVNLTPNSSFCVAALLLVYRAPLWAPGLCSESVPKCFYSYAQYTLWALGGLSAEHPWFLFPIDESHTTGLNVALAAAPPSSTLHNSFV